MSVFTGNPLINGFSPVVKKYRLNKGFLPNINPIIYGLSTYSSNINDYTVVYITGENFFPFGSSSIKFGSLENLSVTYYSSFNISFIIPQIINYSIQTGTYTVQVTNINNSTNLFPSILYSNKVSYTLT
jgi:hypothetical protein